MPRFRVDYDVTSDLVFPPGQEQVQFQADSTTFVLRNGPLDEQGNCKHLVAVVIGDAEDISKAIDTLSEPLAQQLDLLCFTTQHRFQIDQARRAFLWEPHVKDRPMLMCQHFDHRYPPFPELVPEHIETAKLFIAANPPSYLNSCLRSFRFGCIGEQVDEQFKRFFSVVEVIAEATKAKEEVAYSCTKCKADVQCAACGHVERRVPMAKQAIDQLLKRHCGGAWDDVSKRIFKVRNGLIHGRRHSVIEAETGWPLSNCTDEMARLAWEAIMEVLYPLMPADVPFELGHRGGQFAQESMTAKVHGYAVGDDSVPFPAEDKLPSGTITITSGLLEPPTQQMPDGGPW